MTDRNKRNTSATPRCGRAQHTGVLRTHPGVAVASLEMLRSHPDIPDDIPSLLLEIARLREAVENAWYSGHMSEAVMDEILDGPSR